MGYYPAFLELEGKPCLVVGGGAVAQRKVEALREAGAQVTVVAPRLGRGLVALAQAGQIAVLARRYRPGDLRGMALTIAATSDPAVNRQVAAEARRRGLWVNVVDQPSACGFIVPSVVRRGELTLAISTGGRSPALARRLRRELEAWLDSGYAELLGLAAEVRQELRRQGRRPSPARWQKALDAGLLAQLRAGQREQARSRLLAALGEG